jgi:hypothetical protein
MKCSNPKCDNYDSEAKPDTICKDCIKKAARKLIPLLKQQADEEDKEQEDSEA